jgi:non-canonical (house-cleaning) NTP pyrophosphatase
MQAGLPPLLLQPSLSPTDSLHLLVASRQPVKIAAVEEAANRIWKLASRVVEASPETLFTEPPSTIAPIKSGKKNKSAIDSTKSTTNTSRKLNIVNPQPVGREETFRGCMDRFLKQKAQCDKRVGEGDVILVSVENGIILDNGDGQITPSRAFDQACILVERITLPCSQKETESEQNGTKAVTSPCKKGPVCVWSDAVEFPFSFYEKSRESGFQKTAGSFLAPTSSNDWHASYGEGKSRRQLLTDAITRAFLLLQ